MSGDMLLSPEADLGEELEAKYVIIGNSAGGIGAVEAIRQHDSESGIVMISDEKYSTYSRPLIADFLAGEKEIGEILYRPVDFYQKKDVFPLTDARVEALDIGARKVHLADKARFPEPLGYERLLLATGGTPFVPPMKGVDRKGIHTFVTLADAIGIKEELDDVEKVLVVGGGLIGISVTEALVARGKEVTIVELLDRVLNVNLDKLSSGYVQERLNRNGVKVIVKDSVEEFLGQDGDEERMGGAVLQSGLELDFDMAVIAIGVRPRTELAEGTDIEINKGIVVDRYMESSVPGVYACGDVAEAYDFVWDENRLSPVWPNAYMGGRTAGLNMAGISREYEGSTGMTSFTYFDLPVVSAGMQSIPRRGEGNGNDQEGGRYEVIFRSRPEEEYYKKFVLMEGRVKGFIMVGDVDGAGIVTDLMRDKEDVSSFKDNLLEADFGLAHLPEALRNPRMRGDH